MDSKFDIKKATYLSAYKMQLEFADGNAGILDFQEYVGQGVFVKFKNKNYFKKFSIDHGIISWGAGELDIAPETMYFKITGQEPF